MIKSCIFLVPTIMARPELEISSVEKLAKTFKEAQVYFISNVEDEDFNKYVPTQSNIQKVISGTKFSISKALNKVLRELDDEKYVCFVHSDIVIPRELIESCIKISDTPELNVGVLGVESRSNHSTYGKDTGVYSDIKLKRVLWSDGIMFFTREVFEEVGYFNEDYFGDKESQEYCYRVHDKGFSNYKMTLPQHLSIDHHLIPFTGKVKYDKEEFKLAVEQSRTLFRSIWHPWEPEQKHFFQK